MCFYAGDQIAEKIGLAARREGLGVLLPSISRKTSAFARVTGASTTRASAP